MRTLETVIQKASPTSPCGIRHKIWIDLDNSPHVPFFVPVIEELKQRRYTLLLTARDNAQVAELLRCNQLECRLYGHHYGKNKLFKILGIGMRSVQLAPLILREKPHLALSHGSRSQIVLSSLLKIPCMAITDYEHAKMRMAGIRPQWLMVPEIIANAVAQVGSQGVLTYPGIKEDVYVPRFRPEPGIREELGFTKDDVVVTIRPPASDAHYHSPMSDELFRDVVEFLGNVDRVRMVMLPRNKDQATSIQQQWPRLITTGKIVIPDHAVDGLNLMWFSDLVISGGGTMNREAAALGVPVYSIFRGKPAAVDRYLAANGRLVLLENPKDVETIRLVRRELPQNPNFHRSAALTRILENVIATVELACL
jgi:uncharacterized protein